MNEFKVLFAATVFFLVVALSGLIVMLAVVALR